MFYSNVIDPLMYLYSFDLFLTYKIDLQDRTNPASTPSSQIKRSSPAYDVCHKTLSTIAFFHVYVSITIFYVYFEKLIASCMFIVKVGENSFEN